MSHHNHPRNTNQSNTTYRPKDSFRQEGFGTRGGSRTLSDRIHLPFEDRLERPNSQNQYFNPFQSIAPIDKMDPTQRSNRYYNQGEGNRGSLDDRIGLSDFQRGATKAHTGRNRREDQLSYDEKPASRNFEDRVNTDNRTLEDRISVVSPASKKATNVSNGEVNTNNRPASTNSNKQNKKAQNKVQKQELRAQESVMLTESQLQEEINGGTTMNKDPRGGVKISAGGATAGSDDASKDVTAQPTQPVARLEVDTKSQPSKKDGQLEGVSPSSAAASTPSPMATTLQEQLREKVLASMKKKAAEAQTSTKERENISMPPKVNLASPLKTEVPQPECKVSSDEPSALSALEHSLNMMAPIRKVDPERDAAVDAMLAEVQAFSEDKKASQQKAAKLDKDGKAKLETDIFSPTEPKLASSDSAASKGKPSTATRPIPNIVDRKSKNMPHSPKEINANASRRKESEKLPEKEVAINYEKNTNQTSKSDAREKLANLPPIETASSSASQASSAKFPHRHDHDLEDDYEYSRRERYGPFSAPPRPLHQGINKRARESNEDIDQIETSGADRKRRHWEDRNDLPDRESHKHHEDRPRPEYLPPRAHPKEPYRDENYRNNISREDVREPYYSGPRLSQLPQTHRPLPVEEYSFSGPDYPSFPPSRYLPLRGEEHIPRHPDYDPYYKDLAEWLEITGFHDIDYRQVALRRHRERELDRLYALRAAAASAPREDIASPVDLRIRSGSSLMPPPQLPLRGERGMPSEVPVRAASRNALYASRSSQLSLGRPDDRPPPLRYTEAYRHASPGPESSGLKRRISQEEVYEGRRPEKSSRLNYDGAARISPPHHENENVDIRGGRMDNTDTGGPGRRVAEFKEHDEGRLSPPRKVGRPNTPVREIQEKLAARSPSPPRNLDSEHRRIIRKDTGVGKNRQLEEDQNNAPFTGKKPHEKGNHHLSTPDASPKGERGTYKGRGGYNNQGKFDDRRPAHGHDYDDEYRRAGQGNFTRRRGSFDDYRRQTGYGRGGGGEYNREWYRSDRKDKFPPSKQLTGSDPMEVDAVAGPVHADTRYFIVKSFNHDNVLHAQRDGVWATQEKNAETFSEAFRTARDVILIFSVNKSGKFQGYARMESAPGTAEMPEWSKGLLWKSSGAFHIRWITICDISFYHLAPLLNRLNEDQPVFIGRDGQEIDPETGATLCGIVDERAGAMYDKN